MSELTTVVGNVASDPRKVESSSETSFVTFRLASTERKFDRESGTWSDGHVNWYTVSAFRHLGDRALATVRRGERIIVHGRLRVRSWQSGEKSGTEVSITADAIGQDIRFGPRSGTQGDLSEATSQAEHAATAATVAGDSNAISDDDDEWSVSASSTPF